MRIIALLTGIFVATNSLISIGQPLAPPVQFNYRTEIFINKNCEETNTCDLVSVRMQVNDFMVRTQGEPVYGSKSFIEYKTRTIDQLTNYVVVKLIKGSTYFSIKNSNSTVTYENSIVKEHFNKFPKFSFRDWVIDSLDEDPAYNSDPEFGRFYSYRWNEDPNSFEEKTEHYYSDILPKVPRLYVRDITTAAFYDPESNRAKNVDLQFRGCIYRAKDVPFIAKDTDINFAKPIHCFSWHNYHVYNHWQNRFVHRYNAK